MNETPELAQLPWEYLYNLALNEFLALGRETPVTYEPPTTQKKAMPLKLIKSGPDLVRPDPQNLRRRLNEWSSAWRYRAERSDQIQQLSPFNRPARQQLLGLSKEPVKYLVTEVLFIDQQRGRYLASGDQPATDNGHERRIRGNDRKGVRVLRVCGTENFKRDFPNALGSDSLKLSESSHLRRIEPHRQGCVNPVTTTWTRAKQHFHVLPLV
jgi:hypothetical protein